MLRDSDMDLLRAGEEPFIHRGYIAHGTVDSRVGESVEKFTYADSNDFARDDIAKTEVRTRAERDKRLLSPVDVEPVRVGKRARIVRGSESGGHHRVARLKLDPTQCGGLEDHPRKVGVSIVVESQDLQCDIRPRHSFGGCLQPLAVVMEQGIDAQRQRRNERISDVHQQ